MSIASVLLNYYFFKPNLLVTGHIYMHFLLLFLNLFSSYLFNARQLIQTGNMKTNINIYKILLFQIYLRACVFTIWIRSIIYTSQNTVRFGRRFNTGPLYKTFQYKWYSMISIMLITSCTRFNLHHMKMLCSFVVKINPIKPKLFWGLPGPRGHIVPPPECLNFCYEICTDVKHEKAWYRKSQQEEMKICTEQKALTLHYENLEHLNFNFN